MNGNGTNATSQVCASLALNETAGRLGWDDHVLQNVMKKEHNKTLLSAAVGPGGAFGEMAVLHVRNQTLGGLDGFAIEGRVANASLETAVAAAGTFDWGVAKHLNASDPPLLRYAFTAGRADGNGSFAFEQALPAAQDLTNLTARNLVLWLVPPALDGAVSLCPTQQRPLIVP